MGKEVEVRSWWKSRRISDDRNVLDNNDSLIRSSDGNVSKDKKSSDGNMSKDKKEVCQKIRTIVKIVR